MTGQRIPVTAIVLTYNEAVNIERCLEAMARIDEVVIVDSHSTDETVDLARRSRENLKIFSHPFTDFGDQRNWALDNARPNNEWILFVDADEYCTAELLDEIDNFVKAPGNNVGGFIAGKNYFLGRWLKYSTMYPSYQLRLLKQGQVRYKKEGHGQKEITDGPLFYFQKSWIHNPLSKGIHQWIEKHNKYSTEEVDNIIRLRQECVDIKSLLSKNPASRRKVLKIIGAKIPGRPVNRFIYSYFIRGGILDGMPGLIYCLLLFSHSVNISAKIYEKLHNSKQSKSELKRHKAEI